MKQLRIDTSIESAFPLFEISWEQDQTFRMNPATVTALLREQVPVLDFVKWTIQGIEPGYTKSVLPLNPQSTNQHFTHQAALFVLAGDYTGGTALASLLLGWPVIGVHPVCSPQSASMWLLRAETKYMRPSVGDLIVTARIDPLLHRRIQKRFMSGQAVIETITIEFRNGDALVGEAQLTYFARRSDRLRSEGIPTNRVNSLYELKLTSSAELIAGVRACESGLLFKDQYAEQMAGQHGMALARRFCERSPQLGGMVAARTWHADLALTNYLAGGGRDIVIVGVGWDMRPFRLPLPEGTRVYELDFPTTLAERCKRLSQLKIGAPPGVTRYQIPIDVRTMPLAPALSEYLDCDQPVLMIWEGMSMYFQEEEVRQVLTGMKPVLRHPASLLWLDLVDRHAIEHPEKISDSVRNFMRGMQILGEPFTFGPDSAADFMRAAGLRALEVVSSDICMYRRKDPVYSIYKFCIASAAALANEKPPLTFRPTRLKGKSRTANRARMPNSNSLQSPHVPMLLQQHDLTRNNPQLESG